MGGIEKAAANLVAFEKTGVIEPGGSENVSIMIAKEDLASCDGLGSGCYVLEAGDCTLSAGMDFHTAYDSQGFQVDETVVYDGGNKWESDAETTENAFDFARGDIEYLWIT